MFIIIAISSLLSLLSSAVGQCVIHEEFLGYFNISDLGKAVLLNSTEEDINNLVDTGCDINFDGSFVDYSYTLDDNDEYYEEYFYEYDYGLDYDNSSPINPIMIEGGLTALHLAVYEDLPVMVTYLCRVAGIDMDKESSWGVTTLSKAAKDNLTEILTTLLRSGADVNHTDSYNRYTALHTASAYGHTHLVNILLNNSAGVHMQEYWGHTALHIAAYSGFYDIVELLLASQANISSKDNSGQTALHMASSYGQLQSVQLLVSQGADLDDQDNTGLTPLHLAVIYSFTDIAQLLLDSGADTDIKDYTFGYSALDWATQLTNQEIIRVIEETMKVESG